MIALQKNMEVTKGQTKPTFNVPHVYSCQEAVQDETTVYVRQESLLFVE